MTREIVANTIPLSTFGGIVFNTVNTISRTAESIKLMDPASYIYPNVVCFVLKVPEEAIKKEAIKGRSWYTGVNLSNEEIIAEI